MVKNMNESQSRNSKELFETEYLLQLQAFELD